MTDIDYVIDPVKGPRVVPTHERALAPVQSPEPDVDGFVGAFLRELNFGQGVSPGVASPAWVPGGMEDSISPPVAETAALARLRRWTAVRVGRGRRLGWGRRHRTGLSRAGQGGC